MTPQWTGMALGTFVVLSGGFLANVFLLQPVPHGAAAVAMGPAGVDGAGAAEGAGTAAWSLQLATHRTKEEGGALASPSAPGEGAELTRAIQRELQSRGYEPGAVDGVPGLVTRAAIMAFEADHGMPLTGEPRQALLRDIVLGGEGAPAPRTATAVEPGSEAETVIRTVEENLRTLGYVRAAPDGRLEEETIGAIRRFEAAQGMRQTGRISAPLVSRLALATGRANSAARR